jgi:4-diphosphocytidyl-2-C-methyl-D-erythritol kinase
MLSATRNDLEAPAALLRPEIPTVLERLRASAGCQFARMSGSGATCFAVYDSIAASEDAARAFRKAEPDWWAEPCRIKLPS